MIIKQILLAGIMLGTIGNIGLAMEPEAAMTPITKWTDVTPFANTFVAYRADSPFLDSAIWYQQEGDDDETPHKPCISSDPELNYGYIEDEPLEWSYEGRGYLLCKLRIPAEHQMITDLTDNTIARGAPLLMRRINKQEAAKIITALDAKEAIFGIASSRRQEMIKELLEDILFPEQ
jgi:hypothetical protein